MFRRGARITAVGLVVATLASANAFAEEADLQWYASLSALYDMPSDSAARLGHSRGTVAGDIRLSDEVAFALALGVETGRGLRVELEVASRSTDINGASGVRVGGVPLPEGIALSGELKTWTLMANLRHAFGEGSFRPYVGVGLGFARHDGEATLDVTSPLGTISGTESGDDDVIAYQVMAGVEGDIGENVMAFAGFRHLRSGDLEIESFTADYATTSIDVGIRMSF
jgi:opacity protein-like surface antigen